MIIKAANLPLRELSALAKDPETVLGASVGSARASPIRKRVREWRRLRDYCPAATLSPWPSDVGVILEYLQERHLI